MDLDGTTMEQIGFISNKTFKREDLNRSHWHFIAFPAFSGTCHEGKPNSVL